MHNPLSFSPCSQSLARPFHSCRKFRHIYFGLCGPMHFNYDNENKCTEYNVDDYTRMRWLYLLKGKSQAFKTFNNFHVWIGYEA